MTDLNKSPEFPVSISFGLTVAGFSTFLTFAADLASFSPVII
jgi:hypothetical protein